MNKLEVILKGTNCELFKQYNRVVDSLLPVHDEVVSGASFTDGGWLTDHGPRHIERVGSYAADICKQMGADLVPYELFFLLLAIQVHDIANISGRTNHENRINDIWERVFGPLGFDELDKIMAIQIASAHGGTFENSKSTLRAVDTETKYKNSSIRPRLLAAILKLADELADDVERASIVNLEIGNLPKECVIYHIYSAGLHTTHMDASTGTIELKLAFSSMYFNQKLGKGQGEVFLLDEIYERTLKTWSEAIYCSRFIPNLLLTTVDVDIQIFDKKTSLEVYRIKYRLEDIEYPTVAASDIYDVCPQLADFKGGGRLTPESLKAELASTDNASLPGADDKDDKNVGDNASRLGKMVKSFSRMFR